MSNIEKRISKIEKTHALDRDFDFSKWVQGLTDEQLDGEIARLTKKLEEFDD